MEAPASAAAQQTQKRATERTLGKFEFVEPIGSGGMAQLYLARTAGLGGFEKRVVVKQILPHLAEDAEFIARFIQEARLTATLDHPNIAAVYEVDVDDGIYFYSMEYVRGRDLRKVLRRASERGRALTAEELVAIVSALCGGLHHAHTKRDEHGEPLGIVHRDVSPSNVLIGFEGAVKLTDFGVAKAQVGMVSTVAGTLRGKIPYMSPEQCRGEALDRRSDVYAVGVLMWEMLTGTRLHQADSEMAIIRRIAEVDAPSPRGLRPDCPVELERIVMRALQRSPATRYQSAASLQEDLEELGRRSQLRAGSSSVTRLMEELFADEQLASLSSATVADEAPPHDEAGTSTAAPPRSPPEPGRDAALGSVATRSRDAFEEAPTQARGGEHRPEPIVAKPKGSSQRAWRSVAAGLVIGVALGGGSLYVASQDAGPGDPVPTEAAGAVPVAAAQPASTRAAAEVVEAVPAPAVEPEPIPADEVAPTETPAIEGPPPGATSRRKPSSPRKKTKRRKPINLDSAMPPGLGG